MSSKLQQAAWRMILPEIRKIVKEEIQSEVSIVNTKMESEFKVVHSEIRRLDEKVEGFGKGLDDRIDGLEKRLDVVQRLAVVEAKLKEYEQKQRD